MEASNTYITYAKLLSLVHPYFLMSWWEDFMSNWELAMLINLAIQDTINNSSFSFMSEFNKVQGDEELYEWTYRIFRTKYPINRVNELLIEWEWDDVSGDIINTMPYTNSNKFFYKRWTNIIYGNKNITSITINYEKDYIINDLVTKEDHLKTIPLPFSFVPSLIKMIYDHWAIFTFFQWEWTSTDFYWHAKTRVNDLVNTDILVANQKVQIWEY